MVSCTLVIAKEQIGAEKRGGVKTDAEPTIIEMNFRGKDLNYYKL